MSKKLNSMPDYQARMPRFQHDLSQSLAFTSSTGMLLPVYYHPLHLGDRLRYQGNLSARLNPISKPTVGTIDLHVDYFFVPLSVIYLPALNLFYQTDDHVSGIFNEPGLKDGATNYYLDNTSFPRLDVSDSLHAIKTAGANIAQSFNGVTYPSNSFDVSGKAAFRLCDLLDYSPADLFDDGTNYNPTATPWYLAAYHAIYENYAGYRNSDREKRSYLYNLDKYYAYQVGFTDKEFFALHYVDAYKDYFNSIKVSPVGASVSMLGQLNGQSDPWSLLGKVNSFLADQGNSSVRVNSAGSTIGLTDDTAVSIRNYQNAGYFEYNFTAANIRQLFMVDKLLRVVGRADKNYEAQFLAHFGVKIPHDVLHNITHLGHDMFELNPSPTISTADTFNSTSQSGSSLGEVGGQGYVRGDGRLRHFEAPCHGIFMAIYHAKPRFRYYAGVSKLHDLSSPDKWWQPEFDRRGMQPVFSYEVVRLGMYGFTDLSERLGWQFAYEQFKRKFDKVTRAFASMGSNSGNPPMTNSYAPWFLSKVPFYTTSLSSFAPISGEASPQIFTQHGYNFLSFKTLATDLNITMEVPYTTTWINNLAYADAHSLFYTDPLIIDYRMNCKISNFMSEYGEPELGD